MKGLLCLFLRHRFIRMRERGPAGLQARICSRCDRYEVRVYSIWFHIAREHVARLEAFRQGLASENRGS